MIYLDTRGFTKGHEYAQVEVDHILTDARTFGWSVDRLLDELEAWTYV